MSDTAVAGYALLIPYWSNEFGGIVVLLDELLVEQQFRGQGIGRAFLRFLDEHRPFEAVALALEVSPKNAGARALYESMGFEERKFRMMTRRLRRASRRRPYNRAHDSTHCSVALLLIAVRIFLVSSFPPWWRALPWEAHAQGRGNQPPPLFFKEAWTINGPAHAIAPGENVLTTPRTESRAETVRPVGDRLRSRQAHLDLHAADQHLDRHDDDSVCSDTEG